MDKSIQEGTCRFPARPDSGNMAIYMPLKPRQQTPRSGQLGDRDVPLDEPNEWAMP